MQRTFYHLKSTAIALALALSSGVANAQTNLVPDDVEFRALKAIYDSLGGANWGTNTKWPTPGNWPSTATATQMGKWYGVTVSNGDVTGLTFHPQNNLIGKIPLAIGNLTALTKLDMSANSIYGRIPSTIGQLTKLTTIKLSSNQMTGSIPGSMASLVMLKQLDLHSNQLSGKLPSIWDNMTLLNSLTLHQNQFTGQLPSSIGNLVNLTQLYLNNNQFSGELPSNLGGLLNLQYFYANGNHFSGALPASISSWNQIYLFYVNDNNFFGPLPDNFFASWTKLGLANFSNNGFNGTFPSSIGNCAALTYLAGNHNGFASFPSSSLSLPLVTTIDFSDNELKSIPDFSTQVNKLNLLLQLGNNRLDFSQLEPLIGKGIKSLPSLAQKTINDVLSQSFTAGEDLLLSARPKGASTSNIRWEKLQSGGVWGDVSSTNMDPVTGITYHIGNATVDAEGTYRWSCTSSLVTGFTLTSEPIVVKSAVRLALDDLGFQYKYDQRKRMIARKVPGADWVYIVYDKRDRVVMTQDGKQRAANQWTITKYDAFNRPVMTALYAHGSNVDQAGMTALIDQVNFYESYTGLASNHGYTNTVWPTSNYTVLTANYYDSYSFVNDLSLGSDFHFLSDHLSGQETLINNNVTGLLTGTKTSVLGSASYLYSVAFYDNKYRTIQTVSQNNKGGYDRSTSIVDFIGQVLNAKTTHHTSNHSDQTITKSFDYDHVGRLMRTWHSLNGATPVLLAQNEYNKIGQLIDKKLFSTDNGGAFKQSVDYRYNIRGWLTSMNNSQLINDGISNDDSGDLFGMELGYANSIGTGNTPMFSGLISGIKWSNNLALGAVKDVAYNYSYDLMNRITGAKYQANNSGVWSNPTDVYSETGYQYDQNGNIQKLTRKSATGGSMDILGYTYNGNQLVKVDDTGDKTKGFVDGKNQGDDYSYDANGNLVTDNNKDFTDGNAIQYNHLDLPIQVTKNTGEKIVYTYDAGGSKLSEQVYLASGKLQKGTDYDGDFLYQGDTLQFINHDEGRIVLKNVATPEYQYHLKDHLGNVRMTFTTLPVTDNPLATFEPGNQNVEQSQFLRMDDARLINSTLFDHTHNGTTAYSERLTGSANEKTGIARSISVMPGDVINMEVYAKYVDASNSNNTADLINLIALAGATSLGAGTGVDGANYSTNGTTPFPYKGLAGEGANTETGTGPRAYLNYIMFDRNFVPISPLDDPSQTNFVRMTTEGKEDGRNLQSSPNGVPHQKLSAQVIVKQAGYMYIYLSNEESSPVEVYFDDFKVTQIKSPVVQQQDFYPFGLTARSYNRENSVPNNFLFNGGTELRTDLGFNMYQTLFRLYDPALGRFAQIDPLADFFPGANPYNFVFNNPISFNDPYGLGFFDWLKRLIRGFVGDGSSKQARQAQDRAEANGVTRTPGHPTGARGSSTVKPPPPPPEKKEKEKPWHGKGFDFPDAPLASGPKLSGGPKITQYEPPRITAYRPPVKKIRPPVKKIDPPSPTDDDPRFRDKPIRSGNPLIFDGYQFEGMKSREYHTPPNNDLIRDLVKTLKDPSVHLDIQGNFNGEIIEGGWWSRPLGYPSADEIQSLMSARAKAIRDALIKAGVPASQLSTSPGQAGTGKENQSATFTLSKP